MKFAAIDPGTKKLGWCILELKTRKLIPVDFGTIQAKNGAIHKRLSEIHDGVSAVFQKHKPKQVILERAFFGKNAASALRLGESRGVVLAVAGRIGAKLFEYTAVEAKRAVTASGRAAKSAVQRNIQLLLGLEEPPEPDAADAVALGICHACKELGW